MRIYSGLLILLILKSGESWFNMTYIDLLISGILAFIMLSVGLSLTWRNFLVVFARPKGYLGGLALQLLVLPTAAYIIATLARLPVELKVGIMILSSCPGGTTSNFITYLLNANTALAILLTVTNSFIALISVPLIVNFGLSQFMGEHTDLTLPFGDTVRHIFGIILVPVFLGLLIRRFYPNFAMRVRMPLKWMTVILLGIVFFIKLFAGEAQGGTGISTDEILQILPYSLLGNTLNLTAGFCMAYFLGLPANDRLTLGVEVGIQNTSLAFLIGSTLLNNEEMIKPALVYAMFTFFTAVVYGMIVKPNEWHLLRNRFSRMITREGRH